MKNAIPGTNSNKNKTMKTNVRDYTNIIKNVFSTLTPKKKKYTWQDLVSMTQFKRLNTKSFWIWMKVF